MSTLLKNLFEEFFGEQKHRLAASEIPCSMCRGEIYSGEHYYELDGRKVCESCLERYARQYFARQRRRLCAVGKEDT